MCFINAVLMFQYLTEGLLIREMMSDPLLRQYSVIMLDEVHERTVNSDILMGLLRKILKVSTIYAVLYNACNLTSDQFMITFESST